MTAEKGKGCGWFDDQKVIENMTDKRNEALIEEDPFYCIG